MANSLTTDLHVPSNKKPYSDSPLSQGKRTREELYFIPACNNKWQCPLRLRLIPLCKVIGLSMGNQLAYNS